MSEEVARSARRKAYRNVVLPLFIVSVIAYVDRVNIGYAALTMNADLGFDPRVFGLGPGSSSPATSCSRSRARSSPSATARGCGSRAS